MVYVLANRIRRIGSNNEIAENSIDLAAGLCYKDHSGSFHYILGRFVERSPTRGWLQRVTWKGVREREVKDSEICE